MIMDMQVHLCFVCVFFFNVRVLLSCAIIALLVCTCVYAFLWLGAVFSYFMHRNLLLLYSQINFSFFVHCFVFVFVVLLCFYLCAFSRRWEKRRKKKSKSMFLLIHICVYMFLCLNEFVCVLECLYVSACVFLSGCKSLFSMCVCLSMYFCLYFFLFNWFMFFCMCISFFEVKSKSPHM